MLVCFSMGRGSMKKNSQYLHLQFRKYIVSLAHHADIEVAIPSERELAEMFQTTRETIRVALNALVNDNYLIRYPRRGYYLNPHSSSNILRNKKIIGLLIGPGNISFYDEGILCFIREVCDAAIDYGYLLQILYSSPESLGTDISRSNLDGLLWLNADGVRETFEKVTSNTSMPTFGLFNYQRPSSGHYIYLNHYHEFYQRTKYLIACGCRRIVSVAYSDEIAAGYRDALSDAGIPFNPELLVTHKDFAERLPLLYRQFSPDGYSLRGGELSTLLHLAEANSLRCPDDYQVIIDNIKLSPDLTRTIKPVKEVVSVMFSQLSALMEGKSIIESDLPFKWKIHPGYSTKLLAK